MSVRRSICLYTPSTDPSGMGAHMVDLIAEFAGTADVALMLRPTVGGLRLLDRAAVGGLDGVLDAVQREVLDQPVEGEPALGV